MTLQRQGKDRFVAAYDASGAQLGTSAMWVSRPGAASGGSLGAPLLQLAAGQPVR